jgi:ABC-type polysaccharide/polyol phosphate transport system ATPase subunit
MRTETALQLSQVSVHYSPAVMGRKILFDRLMGITVAPFVALDAVDLRIIAGESVGVVGCNGAGKSTLLRVAAGILPPTLGQVRVGRNVTALIDLSAGLEGALSGRDNIKLAAKLQRIPSKLFNSFLEYVRDFSELGEALARPVRTYSSGMALRLAFSLRTFLHPDLLVMDEVFGVGDHNFSLKARGRTTQLLRAASSLLFASHDANLIREFCTSAVWLDRGKLKAFGPAAEVLAIYESTPAGGQLC